MFIVLLVLLTQTAAFAGVEPSHFSTENEPAGAEISKQSFGDVFFIETGEQILISGDIPFFKLKNKDQARVISSVLSDLEEQKNYLLSSKFIDVGLSSSLIIFPFHYFW
ncbi:MAG TPA: hypothetical protein VFM70_08130 [Salinimicrobium sp.]|nr:hypothetical protein [Salinimicrobium sp.]